MLGRSTQSPSSFFSSAIDLLCSFNIETKALCFANGEWSKLLGYNRRHLKDKNFVELIHPNDRATTLDALSRNPDILIFTNRCQAKDNTYHTVQWRGSIDDKGIVHLVGRTSIEQVEDFKHDIRVLIAEDNLGTVTLYKKMLTSLQIPFDIAKDGKEALEKLPRQNYELVLTDFHMPGMDGLALVKAIRAEEKQALTKRWIVALTSDETAATKIAFEAAGANRFEKKPLTRQVIKDILNEFFRQFSRTAPTSSGGAMSSHTDHDEENRQMVWARAGLLMQKLIQAKDIDKIKLLTNLLEHERNTSCLAMEITDLETKFSI